MLSLIFSLGGWLQEAASTSPSTLFISSQTRVRGLLTSLVKTCYQLLDITGKTSRCLGRESELVRVCCCLFDPVINEANESSSACSPELRRPVETRTPPFREYGGRLTLNRRIAMSVCYFATGWPASSQSMKPPDMW